MKDKITKFLAYNGKISIICADTKELVEQARIIHDLSPVATAAFGRLLTISAIMASNLKSKTDKLTIQLKGDGPLGMMVIVGNNEPTLKGYVTNAQVDLPLNEFGKLDVGTAVGSKGYINVIKDLGLKEPYIGISPLTTGEIADDFTNYFATSEQTNSAVALGVLVNKDGIKASGGYMITPMPDASEEEISKVEQAIFKAGAISKMLDNNLSLIEIAKQITGDENVQIIQSNIVPKYKCDCSKQTMADGLKTLGKEELQDIIEKDKEAELVCHFCNKKYKFKTEELEKILADIT